MSEEQTSRVLIVDDVPINCVILSSLLASNGVTSDVATGGKECLKLCEENSYDLILLDHRMPEMDGVDTLVQLKEMFKRQGREVPVVCHTTEDARKNINLYKAAGFVEVRIKPIEPKRLSEILMTYLPDGDEKNEKNKKVEQEKIKQELEKLPDWIKNVEGIDAESGIEHCETAEDYLDALSVFKSSIQEKTSDIEHFLDDANWKMYTLKSMSRLIGAKELSKDAAELEAAGKKNDIDTIIKRTPKLLETYRGFILLLAPIEQENKAHEGEASDVRPEISDETLKDAYTSMTEFALCYDTDSVQMVLDSLMEYKLKENDERRISDIRTALSELDWEKLRGLLTPASLYDNKRH